MITQQKTRGGKGKEKDKEKKESVQVSVLVSVSGTVTIPPSSVYESDMNDRQEILPRYELN